MTAEPDKLALVAILASLGREICVPLDNLREDLDRANDDEHEVITEKQRAHAQTMMTLCEELTRLTRETLGRGGH